MSVDAQEYSLAKTIEVEADFIQTDKLGNLYIVSDFSVKKYNNKGDFLFEYEDYQQGKISHIDVTDPLKILLFHQDFLSIKVLDKTLSTMSSYDFSSTDFNWVSCVAHARDDNFWLFDVSTAQLKKVNESGEVFNESESFRQILDEEIIPIYMVEQEAQVFLTDGESGIYVFDEFGTYIKRISLLDVAFFQVIQSKIIYWQDGKLKSYYLKTFEEEEMNINNTENPKQVILAKDQLYLLADRKVSIYSLQQK